MSRVKKNIQWTGDNFEEIETIISSCSEVSQFSKDILYIYSSDSELYVNVLDWICVSDEGEIEVITPEEYLY